MAAESKNVLVIDDDITIRKLLSHHLKTNSFQTMEAESAEDGLQ